ncbi:MAG: hypothetical protein RSE18_11320, partial [Acinetobacter sp.]
QIHGEKPMSWSRSEVQKNMWNDLWEQTRTKRNAVLHFYSGISDSAQYYHKNEIGSFGSACCFAEEADATRRYLF